MALKLRKALNFFVTLKMLFFYLFNLQAPVDELCLLINIVLFL